MEPIYSGVIMNILHRLETLEKAQAPAPKTTGLTFMEAVDAMRYGAKVRHKDWYDGIFLNADRAPSARIKINNTNIRSGWVPTIDEVLATDWVVVTGCQTSTPKSEPKVSGLTFMEAVEAIKRGKTVRRKAWKYAESFALDPNQMEMVYESGTYFDPSFEDIEATDWQIVE